MAVSFTLSFERLQVIDSDNSTSVQNATRNAMTQSVNLGATRVNEEVSINREVAIEAVVRQYADSYDFAQGERYLNVYDVSSSPPMIAVEAYTLQDSPFRILTNKYKNENKPTDDVTRSREVQIIEAKDINK